MRLRMTQKLQKVGPDHIEVVKLYNYSVEIPLDFQEIAKNSRFRLLDIHLEAFAIF